MLKPARWGTLFLAVTLSIAGLGLAGCANPIESVMQQDGDGDSSSGAANSPEESVSGAASLPDDFPVADILVSGPIAQAEKLSIAGTEAWTVEIVVADLSAFDDGTQKLTSAGYESKYVMVDEETAMSSWVGEEYMVTFNVSKIGSEFSAYYSVQENS